MSRVDLERLDEIGNGIENGIKSQLFSHRYLKLERGLFNINLDGTWSIVSKVELEPFHNQIEAIKRTILNVGSPTTVIQSIHIPFTDVEDCSIPLLNVSRNFINSWLPENQYYLGLGDQLVTSELPCGTKNFRMLEAHPGYEFRIFSRHVVVSEDIYNSALRIRYP